MIMYRSKAVDLHGLFTHGEVYLFAWVCHSTHTVCVTKPHDVAIITGYNDVYETRDIILGPECNC